MTREADRKSASQVAWTLDLMSLVSDARADRAQSLPADPVFALAVCALACMDQDAVTALLLPPEEIAQAAGRHLHSEIRHELIVRNLRDVVTKTRNRKDDQ